MKVLLRKIDGVLGALIGTGVTMHVGPAPAIPLPALIGGFTRALWPVLAVLGLLVALLVAACAPHAVATPQSGAAFAWSPEHALPLMLIGSVDMFSTNTMLGVVQNLKRVQTGLLDKFFPTVENSQTEEIHFDIDEGKRYLAPFVHPLASAPVKDMKGLRTESFAPAYVKEKARWTPQRAFRRTAGESIGGALTPDQRRQLALAAELEDQVERIQRRKEAMAFEALFTGKLVIDGEGYPGPVNLVFGRDASLESAANNLTGVERWDQANSDPNGNIDDVSEKLDKLCGAYVEHVVLDSAGWKAFRKNKQVQRDFEIPKYEAGSIENREAAKSGLQFKGMYGSYAIWKYTGWYTDTAGTEQATFSGGYGLCIGQIDGTQHHGAIMDEDADGYQPYEVYPKSWVTPEPSVRWVMSQSAPLIVPKRINACAVIKVLNNA